MAVRRVSAGSSGGGAGIPTSRPARARLITGGGSLVAFAAVAADAASTGARLAGVGAAIEVAALVFAAVALLFRWPVLIAWAVLAAGGGYLIGREGQAVVDGRAAVIGVLLLLGAELASWSIDHDRRIRTQRAVVIRRAATLAGLALTALVVDGALLGAASLPGGSGLLVTLTGVGAAVAAIALVVRLIRAAPEG